MSVTVPQGSLQKDILIDPAVPLAEQGAVAGVITSANGISYVLAPALGISLYGWNHDSPFAAFASSRDRSAACTASRRSRTIPHASAASAISPIVQSSVRARPTFVS